MAYYLPKNILPENSLGCHFLLRCSLSCVLIIGPRSTREFSTIICWYYSRYSLVRYRFLVRFHRFFRGLYCSFDIGPHLFTCLRNWTIFDGGGWPLQFFGSNIFNSKWKVRKCWNHGNIFFSTERKYLRENSLFLFRRYYEKHSMSFLLSSSKFFSFMWVHFFTFREHFHKRLDSRNMIFTATARNLQCHWYLTDILSCSVFGTEKVFSKSANRSSIEEYSIAKMFLSYIYSHRNRPKIRIKISAQKLTFYTLILKRCDFPTLWKKDCPLCAKENQVK